MILTEKKLSTKDRNKLDDSMYGLPSERKYPLNDEAHVRKAIQFFKHCKPTMRNELAKNINKRITELNMDVSVSKDNPFSKYANKNTVTITESADTYYPNENIEYIDKFSIYGYNDIIKLESCCMTIMNEYLESSMINSLDGEYIKKINDILTETYSEFNSFNNNINNSYELIESAKVDIINIINNPSKLNDIGSQLDILNMTSNKYHTYRTCCEMLSCIYNSMNDECNDIERMVLENYEARINELKDSTSLYLSNHTINDNDIISENIDIFDMDSELKKTDTFNSMLKSEHSQIQNDLYIIDSVISSSSAEKSENIMPNMYVDTDKFNRLFNSLSMNIEPRELLFAKHCKLIRHIEKKEDIMSNDIYLCKIDKDDEVYLITKDKNSNCISLVLIMCDNDMRNMLTNGTKEPTCNAKLIKIKQNASITNQMIPNNLVSEAFAINEDGDIKITISPKNSYMDSYSSNHKMLVSNWENKNYEAMKKNLAYVFALIMTIERSEEFKNKDPKVIKARAFAINDFKTYLKLLQSVEPDFDFVEYYDASDYDKKIINIPKATIIGIKKLMRTILI